MNPTKIVNVRGARWDPETIYIGRGSEWGNPFVHVGVRTKFPDTIVVADRAAAIEAYRQHLWQRIKTEGVPLVYALESLYGAHLGCYRAPLPCHGDVLAAAAEWAHNEIHLLEQDEAYMPNYVTHSLSK